MIIDFKPDSIISLKSGKISLIVSGLLTSVSLTTPSISATITIDDLRTNSQVLNGINDSLIISNSGSIITSQKAISLSSNLASGQKIENNGLIKINNPFNNIFDIAAFKEDYYSLFGAIINNENAIIEIDSQSNAIGISTSFGPNASIINSGLIKIDAKGLSKGIYSQGLYYGEIKNSGTISINSKSKSYGISTYYHEADVSNSGTISVTSTNEEAIGINADYLSGDISNSGLISVKSLTDEAKGISGRLDSNGNIFNSNFIEVNGTTKAVGLATLGSNGTVINSGTINAKINNEFHSNAYTIENSGNNSFENTSSGVLHGNIKIIGGSLTNKGRISLPHSANATIQTFINETDGVLELGLFTDGTNHSYSRLSSTNATFENSSIIKVDLLNDSSTGLLKGSTLNDVVNVSGSLTINSDLKVEDNSALLNFEYIKDGNTIDLRAIEGSTILNSVLSVNNTSNLKEAAQVFTTINSDISKYPLMQNVISSLNKLSSNLEVAKAVESTTTQTTISSISAGTKISNSILNIVKERQNIYRGSSLNSGDELFLEKEIWFKPFKSFGSQEDKNGYNGFDLKAFGLGIGIDKEYENNQSLGMALFYTKASLDVNNISQKSDLNMTTALIYGKNPIIDDKTNLLYQLGYSWQKNDSKRDIDFINKVAKADYTSKIALLDLILIRNIQINDKLLFQPELSTVFRYYKSPSFSERGAGALNLNVEEFTSSEILLGFGTTLHYSLDNDSKLVTNMGFKYDLQDKEKIVNSSFQGANGLNYSVNGINSERYSYNLGLAYEKNISDLSNINFSYEYQAEGSTFSNNVVSFKFVYKF